MLNPNGYWYDRYSYWYIRGDHLWYYQKHVTKGWYAASDASPDTWKRMLIQNKWRRLSECDRLIHGLPDAPKGGWRDFLPRW